jgi:hypothetical protein
MLLQAMLGLQQDAPHDKLYVDPALPDWLPDVQLSDLRLGKRRFDIRFWRRGKETVFEVLSGKREAVERRSIVLTGRAPGDRHGGPLPVGRPAQKLEPAAVNGRR